MPTLSANAVRDFLTYHLLSFCCGRWWWWWS